MMELKSKFQSEVQDAVIIRDFLCYTFQFNPTNCGANVNSLLTTARLVSGYSYADIITISLAMEMVFALLAGFVINVSSKYNLNPSQTMNADTFNTISLFYLKIDS